MGKIIKNLLFPFINISLPIIFIIVTSLNIEYFCFTLLIGIIMGGIVPLLLIILFKIDTTDCFFKKLIFVIISIIVCIFTWFSTWDYSLIIIPLIIEIISIFFYILIDQSDENERGILIKIVKVLVLSLSNPLIVYIGILLDLINLIDMTKFSIPG